MPRRSSDSPTLLLKSARPDFSAERELMMRGARLVAGVDEAGRGPLAGPVVAAAVILDPAAMPEGLDDSKKLSPLARARSFAAILASSTVAVGTATAAEIDRFNIRQATFLAMRRAIAALAIEPDRLLIDGNDVPPDLAMRATAMIGGDGRSSSIAAASIVAKVLRDRMMSQLGAVYPAYGFERHMGYGTSEHLAAIAAHGPMPQHRRSFAPLKNANAAGTDPTA